MAQWFECKVTISKKADDLVEGASQQPKSEIYLVDALSFTEAEARITKELEPFVSVSGVLIVDGVAKRRYAEIVALGGDKWYKVKYYTVEEDPKTAKEKKTTYYDMVQAGDLKSAYDNFIEYHKSDMLDFEVEQVVETKVMDVFGADLNSTLADHE